MINRRVFDAEVLPIEDSRGLGLEQRPDLGKKTFSSVSYPGITVETPTYIQQGGTETLTRVNWKVQNR
jgi:hypothetical protein